MDVLSELIVRGSGLEMEKNSTDRRVARTRAGLQHALISLIVKKGYDAITVEDICEEANVGRSTFYLHFASKDALKRSGLEHLRKELVDRQKEAFRNEGAGVSSELRFGLALFEHARDHIELYRALVGSGGERVALSGIREILCDLVRSDLMTTSGRGSAETVPMEFLVQYLVGAYMAVLTWWLDKGAKPSLNGSMPCSGAWLSRASLQLDAAQEMGVDGDDNGARRHQHCADRRGQQDGGPKGIRVAVWSNLIAPCTTSSHSIWEPSDRREPVMSPE